MHIHQLVGNVVDAILEGRIADVALVTQGLREYLDGLETLAAEPPGQPLVDEARALLAECMEMSAECISHLLDHLEEGCPLEPEPLLASALEAAEILTELEHFEAATVRVEALVA